MGENISFVIPLKFKVICYISKRLHHISFNKNHKNDSQFLGKSLKYEISSDLKFQGLKIRSKLKFPIYDIYIHPLSFHFRCIWNGSMTASPDISSPTIRSALLKRASQKCIENLSLPLEIGIGKSNQIYYWLVEASEWRSFLSLRKHFFFLAECMFNTWLLSRNRIRKSSHFENQSLKALWKFIWRKDFH